MKRRGFTVLEIVVVLALTGLITVAVSQAFTVTITYQESLARARDRQDQVARREDRIRRLISAATLSRNNADPGSYFRGTDEDGTGLNGTSDRITFITRGDRPTSRVLAADQEFESVHDEFGPNGGTREVSLSLTAVGDSGGRTGLFVREQTPGDGDPTQGGQERVLDESISAIGFEFFDGEQWQPIWDTQADNTPRLPAAVRVSYRLADDETDRVLVVRLPNSDVTPENPVTQEGGAT